MDVMVSLMIFVRFAGFWLLLDYCIRYCYSFITYNGTLLFVSRVRVHRRGVIGSKRGGFRSTKDDSK